MSKRDKLIKELTILLFKRSDDYLFGHLDALLEVRDDFVMDHVSFETLSIMIDIVESVLEKRHLL